MKRNLILSVAAGLVLFVWGFISWAVLPWHMAVVEKFTDEAEVSRVLRDNAPRQGVYYLPFSEQDYGPDQVGAFVSVSPQGTEMDMGKQLATGLLIQIISAFLVLSLAGMTTGSGYWERVGFFALAGLAIGFVSHAPPWNWFWFPTAYVGVMILDILIGWTLVGLVAARFVPGRT